MSSGAFIAVLVMYGLVICGSVATLFVAFKNRYNASIKYFIAGELAKLPVIILIGIAHSYPEMRKWHIFFVSNLLFIVSEFLFCFSVYSLSRGLRTKSFILPIIFAFISVVIVEIIRTQYAFLPLVLYPVIYIIASLATMRVCLTTDPSATGNNTVWRVLCSVEFAIIIISFVRIIANIDTYGLSPMYPGIINAVLLSVICFLLCLRSFCYQAIWMTWLPNGYAENKLNKHLVASLREREAMVQRLSAANRRLGMSAFASSLAHQLSQPLTGAALQAEAIRRRVSEQDADGKTVEDLEKVGEQLNRLSFLVKDLRGLFAETEQRHTPVDLAELVRETLEFSKMSEKAVGVEFSGPGAFKAVVSGNPVQLQQVLINIIDNALDAVSSLPAGSRRIELKAERVEGAVRLIVQDNGCGFSPDLLPHLFDIYRTTKPAGTGIGLWLCKQISEKHKGSIRAENAPTGGASVVVTLPIGT